MRALNQTARCTAAIVVVVVATLIISLPAAAQTQAQDRKTLEKQLRKEYKGKLCLLDSDEVPADLNISVPREERAIYRIGAPLLLRIRRVRVKKDRIEIVAERIIPFRILDGKIRGLRASVGRFTFASTKQRGTPTELAAVFRQTLSPEELTMKTLSKDWYKPRPKKASGQADGEEGRFTEFMPGVEEVGETVTPPMCVECPTPSFTRSARKVHYSGTVVLWIVITPGGWASNLIVFKGAKHGLNEQSVLAVSRWTFKPGMKNGKPVPTTTNIEVNFSIY